MTKEFNSFTLVEQKPLPDIRCDYYLYKHVVTPHPELSSRSPRQSVRTAVTDYPVM